MTLNELGNIGEFVAAVATVITLVYLAFQLRQNTLTLQANAFQNVISEMGRNVENLIGDGELAEIVVRGTYDPDGLSPAESIRLTGTFVSSFRRLESVYVQYTLGTIGKEHKQGFENSLIPLLLTPFGSRWWTQAKSAYYAPFVAYLDSEISSNRYTGVMPTMQFRPESP